MTAPQSPSSFYYTYQSFVWSQFSQQSQETDTTVIPFYISGNWSLEWLNKLYKIMQLVMSEPKSDHLPFEDLFLTIMLCPGRWLRWLEWCPVHQKAAGLIPGWGMYGRQRVDVFFSHRCFSLSLSLSPPSSLSDINKT